MITAAEKFRPQRDFTPTSPAPVDDISVGEPMMTLEEAERLADERASKARAEGFVDGRAAGEAAADEKIGAAVATAASSVKAQLNELLAMEDKVLVAVETCATRLVLALAEKLTLRMTTARAEDTAAAIAKRAIEAARGAPFIRIRAQNHLAAALRKTLGAEMKDAIGAGRIRIDADQRLSNGAVCVDWDLGGVSYDHDDIERKVNSILQASLNDLHALSA